MRIVIPFRGSNMNKVLLIFLLALSGVANAGDGNYLKETCLEAEKLWSGKAGDQSKGNYCIGLVKGIVTTMTMTANSTDAKTASRLGICKADKSGTFVTTEQALASVLKFIYANPDKLSEQDFILTMQALKKSYPCK